MKIGPFHYRQQEATLETKAFEKIIDDCARFTDAPIMTDYRLEQDKVRAEGGAKLDAEQKELDALLERAGIDSWRLPDIRPPGDFEDALLQLWERLDPTSARGHNASSARDLARRTFRKLVFQLRSVELRKQIMQSVDRRNDSLSEQWRNIEDCSKDFVIRLRDERCKPHYLKLASSYWRTMFVFGLILFGIYWLATNLREVILVAVLAAVVVVVGLMVDFVQWIATLHRLDVNLQEAIKYVEEEIAGAASAAQDWRDQPKLFSERERATGQSDDDNDAAPSP